jgi:hypothetical protein
MCKEYHATNEVKVVPYETKPPYRVEESRDSAANRHAC